MTQLIDVPRYTLIFTILLLFILFSPMIASAKHIIVIYDVSGSMVSLGRGNNVKIFMESADVHRVNEYLTNLLFTNTSQSLRAPDDSYIKECEAAFVGKPLYQTGDVLTYAEYAKQRSTKINRAKMSRNEFQKQLPDPTKLKQSFPGMVSFLLRAEVEVYDELYRETDGETYWVFVTDGDIDNSGKSDPGISSILKRLAEIEEEFYAPIIFSLFVNNHVKIEVRQLNETVGIDKIFVAKPTKQKDPVKKIQLTKDNDGKFISETLTIDTNNPVKSKFKLNTVNIEIVDQYQKPLKIVAEDNDTDILRVPSVSLDGNSPSYKFRIPFTANREIANPNNKLKLEITYTYNGENKVYSSPFINYTVFIDSIYIATVENPDRQVETLDLIFSEGKYNASLTIQSESPNKDAFKIDQIRCEIQYKDGRKLCDTAVPQTIKGLGDTFNLEVPKEGRLDWYGNKVVFEIDYQYKNEKKSAKIQIPFDVQGGGTGFPMWLLWALLVPAILLVLFLLYRFLKPVIFPPLPEHHIALTEVSRDGTELGETKYFTLKNEATLEFGDRGSEELRFDVGSEAFLYCDKKNLLLFSEADDDERHILDLPETLILNRAEDEDDVRILCEIVDDAPEESVEEDDTPIFATNSDDKDPLGE